MIKRVCNILSAVLLIVLLAVAGLITVPMLMGYQEMAVLTGSMEPEMPVGSLVYVKPVDATELKPGEVCTYTLEDGETHVTHRVESIDTETKTLITKGDANEEVDASPVAFDQVVGRAEFHVPMLGYITLNIKTPTGIMSVCGVLLVIILLNFIPAIIDADKEDKQKKEAQPEEADSPETGSPKE